jgi:DeoR/GlpR family transcriptional regulator of sugar metabolism
MPAWRQAADWSHCGETITIPLCQIGAALLVDERLEEDMDVDELAQRLHPLASYPADSVFGKRVRAQEQSKRKVGAYVALNLIKSGDEVFIADGSSGLWVMLALLELDLPIEVRTNNAAVGIERVLRHSSQVKVIAAQGEYNSEYGGIFGKEAQEFCEESARNAQVSIMPVTGLTFKDGPCAGHSNARRIKQAVIENASELVLITDVYKMGHGYNPTRPVFHGSKSSVWSKVRDSEFFHVVSDYPVHEVPKGGPHAWGDPSSWPSRSAEPTESDLAALQALRQFGMEAQNFERTLGDRLHLVPVKPTLD